MATKIPENFKYTKEHEWASLEGNVVTIGITDFAQSSLGDIVFVELPEEGAEFDKDAAFGVVESIKSVSDLYSPIAGKVVGRNDSLEDEPQNLNEDPYANWLIKIEVSNEDEYNALMDAKAYSDFCEANS